MSNFISTNNYSASFTAGGLLYNEFDALIDILTKDNRDELLKIEIVENQFLRINSEKSRKRIMSEIKKRIRVLDNEFYAFYSNCTVQEKKLLLFYVCLKVYPLIFTFHFDVTIDNWKKGIKEIDPYFYQMKLDELSAIYPNVDNWTESTKKKVISVYLVMLKQTGFIENNCLKPIIVSNNFWCYFFNNNDHWFFDACLLTSQTKSSLKDFCL